RGDTSPQVPLPRLAPTGGVRGVSNPRSRLPRGARLSPRGRVSRGRDSIPHPVDSGGSARLPRPEPASTGKLLRAAAVAATLQTAADGGGVRALLPDRSMLP